MLQDPRQHALPKGDVGLFRSLPCGCTSVQIGYATNTVFKYREADVYFACFLHTIRGMIENIPGGFGTCEIDQV